MTSRRPPAPLPPEIAQLVRSSLSRRSFLRGMSLSALAVAGGGTLAGCGTPAAEQTTESCVSEDLSASEPEINFSNWPAYIDRAFVERDGKEVNISPTLVDFTKSTGITVNYTTDVNDNVEFFEKVRNQLAACETTERDVFVLTDWMAARMIDLGWIQQLDRANLPNVEAHLAQSLRAPAWDENRDYSVPWQSGLTGIAYNADLTDEVGSFEELLTRSDLNGKVTLLTEMRDTMLFMLLITGADPENFSDDEWGTAIDRLQQAVDDGQIRKFTGNNYLQDLTAGNIAACEAWSGDVILTQFDNPNIKFVQPEEGLSLWSDNMIVPNKATHKANVEKLMDYYYDPVVAARVSAWVNYICPVAGAREAMEKVAPNLVDNTLIFPDEQMLSKTYSLQTLDEETARRYETEFQQVSGG
ncbi:MAG: extracellular solute-binding protein [Actinomycetota bacterium]|nr:extracellular solute-binding protein [Actinomycetota bacterium]